MTEKESLDEVQTKLVRLGLSFAQKGWHPGGFGGFAVKGDQGVISTKEGANFEALLPEDFGNKIFSPLGEALLASDEVGAVLHIYHLDALLCADRDESRGFTHFSDLSILEKLSKNKELALNAPVLKVDREKELAPQLEEALSGESEDIEKAPCVNLLGDGLFVFGTDLKEAQRATEILASLFSYSYRRPMNPKRAAKVSGFQL